MSLTFYHVPMSSSSLTEAVLAELDIPVERICLDIDKGETRTEAFLKINPNGRVPVIVHDGTVLWESAAITLYLGETFGVDKGLYPEPGPRRGEAMKWVVWSNVNLAEAAGRYAQTLSPGEAGAVQEGSSDREASLDGDAEARDRAVKDLKAHLTIMNDALAGQDFLLKSYSLVDTHLHGFIFWLNMMGMDLTPFTHIKNWLDRCNQRPALAFNG